MTKPLREHDYLATDGKLIPIDRKFLDYIDPRTESFHRRGSKWTKPQVQDAPDNFHHHNAELK